MRSRKPDGWMLVTVVVLGFILVVLGAIILLSVLFFTAPTPKIQPYYIPEKAIPLEEMLEHDLAFKYSEWEVKQIETEEIEEVEEVKEDIPFFTEAEKWLIAKVVMSEAEGESYAVKEAIAEVVINRVFSDYREFRYQTAVDEVVLTPCQWAYTKDPNDECFQAVEEAIRENKHPDDMLWARRDYVDYGYEYTVDEGSVTKFSTVTDYSEKAVWD